MSFWQISFTCQAGGGGRGGLQVRGVVGRGEGGGAQAWWWEGGEAL